MDLVLFTGYYPCSFKEQTFLNPEVEYLAAAFERVIIAPDTGHGIMTVFQKINKHEFWILGVATANFSFFCSSRDIRVLRERNFHPSRQEKLESM